MATGAIGKQVELLLFEAYFSRGQKVEPASFATYLRQYAG
jgi:hypothetical protein